MMMFDTRYLNSHFKVTCEDGKIGVSDSIAGTLNPLILIDSASLATIIIDNAPCEAIAVAWRPYETAG